MRNGFNTMMISLTLLLVLASSSIVFAQTTRDLTGTALNEKGDPLQGVTVVLQNNANISQRTTTNEKGIYVVKQLTIGNKYTIKFSFVGFASTEQIITVSKNQQQQDLIVTGEPR